MDRLFGRREQSPSGQPEFDLPCNALGIEHRLTRPRRPQTNGMVECFNGRIANILRTHHSKDGESLEKRSIVTSGSATIICPKAFPAHEHPSRS